MSDGLLIAAAEYWSNGWRGRTIFRATAGRLTPIPELPVPELVEGPPSTHDEPRSATGRPDIELPGTLFAHLTDHHVHLGLVDTAALLPGGLTNVTDLGWRPEAAARWLAQADESLPEVRIAGGFLTCAGGYPTASDWAPPGATIELTTPADAASAVAAQAALGASAIKVTLNSVAGPVPSNDLLEAIVTAARAYGVPVVAHAEGTGQAERAFRAGVDALAHTPFSEPLDDALLEAMASAGMCWISTLDIHGWGRRNAAFETATDNLRRFAALGGRVAYGTDLGNGPLPVGVNGRELRALADAGLDADALVRSIAGSDQPANFGPRFAWVPGLPQHSAAEMAHWLATARGCTIDTVRETLQ